MTNKANNYSDLVIIGNGVAGNNAAQFARSRNAEIKITILSKEEHNEYAAGALPDYLSGALEREKVFIKSTADYQEHDIDIIFGAPVKSIDPQNKAIKYGSKTLNYDKLIIATGSTPIIPPVKGHKLLGNFVFKTLGDTDGIIEYPGSRAVVVGSGAIGVEAALSLKKRGYDEVTIVELMDWIMPKSFDEKPARIMEQLISDLGVKVLTAEKVTAVQGKEKVTGVKTEQGKIACDAVVWAVGVKPDVELAQNAGINLGVTGGIAVDDYMQTNMENIYACGDCIESTDIFSGEQVLNLLWDAACKQGRIAGTNCTGGNASYGGSYGVLLTYIGDTPVLSFGLNSSHLNEQNYTALERVVGVNYQRLVLKDEEIVGLQAIGTLEGSGPILFHLKKGANMAELNKILSNRTLATMNSKSVFLKNYIDKFTLCN